MFQNFIQGGSRISDGITLVSQSCNGRQQGDAQSCKEEGLSYLKKALAEYEKFSKVFIDKAKNNDSGKVKNCLDSKLNDFKFILENTLRDAGACVELAEPFERIMMEVPGKYRLKM